MIRFIVGFILGGLMGMAMIGLVAGGSMQEQCEEAWHKGYEKGCNDAVERYFFGEVDDDDDEG